MRSHIAQHGSEEGFRDPLGRQRMATVQRPRILMHLDYDYKMFFIFGRAQYAQTF